MMNHSYELSKKLSENELSTSWRADDRESGESLFVKVFDFASKTKGGLLTKAVQKSYRLQSRLPSYFLARAQDMVRRGDSLHLLYPWLDETRWQPLNLDVFLKDWRRLLLNCAMTLDFLHEFELVHGDIKLDSFMSVGSGDSLQMVLIDMELIRESGEEPKAIIYGTPGFIAPEILNDERVDCRSDNYSFGATIRQALEADSATAGSGLSVSDRDRLEALASELMQDDYLSRPAYLVDAMRAHGLIDEEQYAGATTHVAHRWLLAHANELGKPIEARDEALLIKFVTHDCRVAGVGEQAIKAMKAYAQRTPRREVVELLRDLIVKASLTRMSSFWRVSMSDEDWLEFYDAALGCDFAWRNPDRTQPSKSSGNQLKQVLGDLAELQERGYDEYAYGLLKDYYSSVESGQRVLDSGDLLTVLNELTERALSLHHVHEAESYCCQLLDLQPDGSTSRLTALQQLTDIKIELSDLKGVKELIDKQAGFETEMTPVERAERTRSKAWVLAKGGKALEAKQLLTVTLENLKDEPPSETSLLMEYNLGVLEWYLRNVDAAIKIYKRIAKKAVESGYEQVAVPVLAALAGRYMGQGKCNLAINTGKQYLKLAEKTGHRLGLSIVLHCIAYCQLSQGNFKKAEHWIDRCREDLAFSPSVPAIVTLQGLHLLLYIRSNRFEDAEELATQVIAANSLESGEPFLGYVLHYYADIALKTHPADFAKRYALAQDYWSKFSKPVGAGQLAIRKHIYALCYGEEIEREELLELCAQELDGWNLIVGSTCVIHALVSPDVNVAKGALQLILKRWHLFRDKSISFVDICNRVAQAAKKKQEAVLEDVVLWKEVLTVLLKAQQKFEAIFVCRHLGRIYNHSNKIILARRFLEHARQLSEELGNKVLVESFDALLKASRLKENEAARILKMVHEISEIVARIEDYEAALHRLTAFAAEACGAERAILFLKRREHDSLRPIASYNCDEESEADATQFSNNVPMLVSSEAEALIIDDAQNDDRTSLYKSIFKFNIKSVCCVPLKSHGEWMGALYLDHHQLPGLFSDEDQRFIESIANFISSVLVTTVNVRSLNMSVEELRKGAGTSPTYGKMVVASDEMKELVSGLDKIARHDIPVLVTGESGVGKEPLCDYIHERSSRADRQIIKLNCAAIPRELIESELFGMVKGASSGAVDRMGKFEAADGSTLLLDEIGELPLEAQAKVLRAIENQEFYRLGSNRRITTDIRLLFSTNVNLEKAVEEGKFREDLYHRIKVVTVHVPPLRERPADVPALVQHFINVNRYEAGTIRITRDAMMLLQGCEWSGNVRELRNVIEGLCINFPGETVDSSMLPTLTQGLSSEELAEKKMMIEGIEAENWNVRRAAARIKMNERTFRRKMKKYGIKKPPK